MGRTIRDALSLTCCLAVAAAPAAQAETVDDLRRRAVELAYSHEHDQAISLLRRGPAIAR